MAEVTTKTHRQLVQEQAAAVQASSGRLIDFSVGSLARALAQAVGGVAMWLQALALRVLASTRLATSEGADADSFIADFGGPFADGERPLFERQAASPSTGLVTFGRLTPSGPVSVPVGATVETQDGTQRFVVVADSSNGNFDTEAGAYLMGDGVASITVPVRALTPGTPSNVLVGQIDTITSPIPGVDTVTNPSDFTNGRDQEGEASLRQRFRSFVQSLREATPSAVKHYVESLAPGVNVSLVEGEELDGTPHRGFFYVVVDDGTGDPSDDLIFGAERAVTEHRAAGIEGAVYRPTVVPLDVLFDIGGPTPGGMAATKAVAVAAVRRFLNAQPVGGDLAWEQLYQVIFNSAASITSVPTLLLNGSDADIVTGKAEVVKAGTVEAMI